MESRDWWPIYRLRLTTPRLELRIPTYDDLLALGDLAAEGIHDPAVMPFSVPWSDWPPEARARSTVQIRLRLLGALTAESWQLPFVVVRDGTVVGGQDVGADDFANLKQVTTGSWLGRRFQGDRLGVEMRAAVLLFAFAGLGAEWATTAAFTDNAASNAISRRLGYEPDGVDVVERRGEAAQSQRYRLGRDRWAEHATIAVEIHGLDDSVRALLGAG
ncbi:MAG TPA: GNAT family protein [Mycobacteriales bacterium]|nr:GNAT family protein [Mycobacteriales bacterium]